MFVHKSSDTRLSTDWEPQSIHLWDPVLPATDQVMCMGTMPWDVAQLVKELPAITTLEMLFSKQLPVLTWRRGKRRMHSSLVAMTGQPMS